MCLSPARMTTRKSPVLTRQGYQELTLADGSIVYAYEPAPAFTTGIHVVETAGGWTAADWEASGC